MSGMPLAPADDEHTGRCGDDVPDAVKRAAEAMPAGYGRDEYEAEWDARGGYPAKITDRPQP